MVVIKCRAFTTCTATTACLFVQKENCLNKSKLHVTFVANDLMSSAHEILLLP